jgi:hypothetical protein
MRKLLRLLTRFVVLFFIVLAVVLLSFYLMAPVYEFSGPRPFHGQKLYNPYAAIKPDAWKMYNFQVQSKAWGGLTNGRKNSNELIDSVYRVLGFDYVATSDYQKINTHQKEKSFYIPTYEHGFNMFRTHQVCIGADEVLWTDFVFFQTLSMKQWILDLLDKHNEIVALAHPLLKNGYTLNDVKYLTHYDMMEVLGNLFLSVEHWDTALSSGQLAWILGDDDAHDVLNPSEVGRKFTMINTENTDGDQIIRSLKSGRNYAVDYYSTDEKSIAEKAEELKRLPFLETAELKQDTFLVAFNKKATTIKFIGENGKVLKTCSNKKRAFYMIQESDPYVRTEAMFDYTFTLFLNPIVRYEGASPQSQKTAAIDAPATLRLRIIYFLIILSLVFLYAKRKQRKQAR